MKLIKVLSFICVLFFAMTSIETWGETYYQSLIGIAATDRNTLIRYTSGYPIIIKLYAEDTKDEKVMVIKSEGEIPFKSIKTDCPRSEKYQFEECWFIKYDKEVK